MFIFSWIIAGLFSIATIAFAEEQPQPKQPDIGKLSEAFGHLISKNLEHMGVKFDIAQVIKGLQDASTGKDSPLTEQECVQAITAVQESHFKQSATENLQKANQFLKENQKVKGIISLQEGKVQYKIEKKGKGASVDEHSSPLLHYTGKFLDGNVFGASKEEESFNLDEVIPGLKAGMVGMKEGEKRTIYIHPDLAYGTAGFLPPNSLLTFEIEVIAADAPPAPDSVTSEIADATQEGNLR